MRLSSKIANSVATFEAVFLLINTLHVTGRGLKTRSAKLLTVSGLNVCESGESVLDTSAVSSSNYVG
jgi:hypothetical protein